MSTPNPTKEFFTETEWDMIYEYVGHALDTDNDDSEQVYSIRAKIHNLFLPVPVA